MTDERLREALGPPPIVTRENVAGVELRIASYPCGCEARRSALTGGWVLWPLTRCEHYKRLVEGDLADGAAGDPFGPLE